MHMTAHFLSKDWRSCTNTWHGETRLEVCTHACVTCLRKSIVSIDQHLHTFQGTWKSACAFHPVASLTIIQQHSHTSVTKVMQEHMLSCASYSVVYTMSIQQHPHTCVTNTMNDINLSSRSTFVTDELPARLSHFLNMRRILKRRAILRNLCIK